MKIYLNHTTTERSSKASEAMSWHRRGDLIQALTYDNNGKELTDVMIHPAPAPQPKDGNREHCRHIAEEMDAYASGDVRRCPECGEVINRDWDDVGDSFRCPECGEVSDPDYWDQLSIWDFLADVYDVEFRVSGRHDDSPRSVRVMVACGGPNIYIDSASGSVELYWWNEHARYYISNEAQDALNEWADEYWGCM